MEYLKSIGIVYLRPYWQNVFSQSFKKELFLNFYLLTVLFLGGKKGNGQFRKDLQFVTGCDEEPPLGFGINPYFAFVLSETSFLPSASTCINQLNLPRGDHASQLSKKEDLFKL